MDKWMAEPGVRSIKSNPLLLPMSPAAGRMSLPVDELIIFQFKFQIKSADMFGVTIVQKP